MNSHMLLELKNSLQLMVQQDRIVEKEALEILRKAGLARLLHEDGWIDEVGNRYYDAK